MMQLRHNVREGIMLKQASRTIQRAILQRRKRSPLQCPHPNHVIQIFPKGNNGDKSDKKSGDHSNRLWGYTL
jgi:hypothetical protein